MKKKVIICLCAPENKGKTSSIRKVYEQFPGSKEILGKDKEDFLAKIEQEENIIGFSSLGDPESNQEKWLGDLMQDYECDIIVTASRMEDKQIEIIEKLSEKQKYSIKWISPIYEIDCEVENEHILEIFHQTNAEVIKKLIDKTIEGEL